MKHLWVIAMLGAACGSMQNAAGPNFPPARPGDLPKDGYEYCQRISATARVRASRLAVEGWALSIAGAGASAAGAAWPLAKSDELAFKQKFGSASLIAGGALVFALGRALLDRSDAASKLAGETASILGETVDQDGKKIRIGPDAADSKCSAAMGSWETTRSSATAFASQLLETKKAEAKASESKATESTRQAVAAKAAADLAEQRLDKARTTLRSCGLGKCPDNLPELLKQLEH
jgi:hypothetical protein